MSVKSMLRFDEATLTERRVKYKDFGRMVRSVMKSKQDRKSH